MGICYQDVFDGSKMCALVNFHGQYYTDSDLLDDYLHFRLFLRKAAMQIYGKLWAEMMK